MVSRRNFTPRLFSLVSAALLGAQAHAIVGTTGSSTPIDTTYSFVGSIDGTGASAVAVGPHTFLTVGHAVSAGNANHTFTLGGVNYGVASVQDAPDILVTDPNSPNKGQMTHVDLSLVTINGTLPGYYTIGTGLTTTSNVTMVGYGQTGGVAADGVSYNVGLVDGARHAGVNSVDGKQDFYKPTTSKDFSGFGSGPMLLSALKSAGGAAVGQGDSGGGWFQGGTLVGISDFILNDSNGGSTTYEDYGFPKANTGGYYEYGSNAYVPAGSAYIYSGAIDLTDPRLKGFLAGANPVPEPTTVAALALGTVGFLRRRRR